jgi:hypothetical protein
LLVGVGVEGVRQAVTGEFNAGRLAGAAGAGVISGAVAGATMGASLVVQGSAAVGAGVAGGVVSRAISGEEQTAGAVVTDAVVSGVTFGVVKGGGALISSVRGASGAATAPASSAAAGTTANTTAKVAGSTADDAVAVAAPKPPPTNRQLLDAIAQRAERHVGQPGRVAGIHKHTYAKRLLDRYQGRYGNRGLETEVSFLNNARVPYGTRGSVRLDVLDSGNGIVYDYKFVLNPPGLTQSQVNRITSNVPGINSVIEINP